WRLLGAERLHDNGSDLAAVVIEELTQSVQVGVGEGQRGAGEGLGYAGRLDAWEEMRIEVGVRRGVGGERPVVPAVVATKQNLVAPRGAAGDTHRDGAGLAAALGVAHHFRTGDGPHQFLG